MKAGHFLQGSIIKTRTIFTESPFINHGNKMAIMTAAHLHFFFSSSVVSRQPKYLNSDGIKGSPG
jgi:hypothetical protein